jgi:hypothetical protein
VTYKNGREGGILTPASSLSLHVFSNLRKTSINIEDLTHSMASDVSTVANNWGGFWPSTDTKDPKAAVERIPPDMPAVANVLSTAYSPSKKLFVYPTNAASATKQNVIQLSIGTRKHNSKRGATLLPLGTTGSPRFAFSSPEGISSECIPEERHVPTLRRDDALC